VIKEIEDALIEKVKKILEPFGFKCEGFPDNTDNYIMTHQIGTVLVVNKGSAYGAPKIISHPTQERTLSFDLTIAVKNLRNHQGAYEVIDALALGLAGWKAPGAIFGARLERDSFVSRDASIWFWSVTIGVPVYLVPKRQEDNAPPISKITATIKELSETMEVTSGKG
jgi:hypothetical protein